MTTPECCSHGGHGQNAVIEQHRIYCGAVYIWHVAIRGLHFLGSVISMEWLKIVISFSAWVDYIKFTALGRHMWPTLMSCHNNVFEMDEARHFKLHLHIKIDQNWCKHDRFLPKSYNLFTFWYITDILETVQDTDIVYNKRLNENHIWPIKQQQYQYLEWHWRSLLLLNTSSHTLGDIAHNNNYVYTWIIKHLWLVIQLYCQKLLDF